METGRPIDPGMIGGWRNWIDVVAFMTIMMVHIWIVIPATGGDPEWGRAFTLAALAVAAVSLVVRRTPLQRAGLRVDNLLPALGVFVGSALLLTSVVLLGYRDTLRPLGDVLTRGTAWLLVWAFLQQFCLLAFLLNRFRDLLGADRAAVLAAASVFAFFHLPNPFLVLYTLTGGLVVAALFLRWPNVLAAAVAHAAASGLAGKMLPIEVTGGMRVGPMYFLLG